MFTFLATIFPLNKVFIYLGIFAALVAGYFIWESHIRSEALAEYNAKQLQQIQADQAKFAATAKAIQDAQTQIQTDLQSANQSVDTKISALQNALPKVTDKTPVADCIPQTQNVLKQLRNGESK